MYIYIYIYIYICILLINYPETPACPRKPRKRYLGKRFCRVAAGELCSGSRVSVEGGGGARGLGFRV